MKCDNIALYNSGDDMDLIIFFGLLLASGLWAKYVNTKHMRQLAKEIKEMQIKNEAKKQEILKRLMSAGQGKYE